MFKASCHSRPQLIRFFEHIDIKEDLTDNTHRQVDHLLVQVDDRFISPLLCDMLTIPNNRINILDDVSWLKHRSYQFSLLAVEVSLTHKESIAVDGFVHELAFRKIVSVLNQNTLHMFWFVEEI